MKAEDTDGQQAFFYPFFIPVDPLHPRLKKAYGVVESPKQRAPKHQTIF
jgi:hypothetical protein